MLWGYADLFPGFLCMLKFYWSRVVVSFYNMEWNVKWDWGDLLMFGSEACGSPKELQLTDWGVDEQGEVDRRSFNLSGFGSSVGGYGSGMGRSSSIKSSISASTDSSPNETLKASSFTYEASNGSQGNLGKDVEQCRDELYRCSPPMEALIGYDGPLAGLKLGKRTVESNSGGISFKLASSSTIPVSSVSAAKKKKSTSQNALIPRCLVEGCNLDLSSAKEYHRKHHVCHSHSKCPKVIIGGAERRFCQQCSRFHILSDFDEKKRSCRRRLSDHNARRRKPQQETIQFNSTRLSSWFYETWGTSEVPKFTITRELTSKPYKAGSINVQSLVGGIKLPGATKMQTNASKGTTTDVFSQGVKENMFSLNMGAAPELPRALFLLSNKSSSEPESTSIGHPTHVNQISITEQAIPENSPLGSEHWQAEQYLLNPGIHALVANGHSGCSFQLSKDPFDNFYFNGLN